MMTPEIRRSVVNGSIIFLASIAALLAAADLSTTQATAGGGIPTVVLIYEGHRYPGAPE